MKHTVIAVSFIVVTATAVAMIAGPKQGEERTAVQPAAQPVPVEDDRSSGRTIERLALQMEQTHGLLMQLVDMLAEQRTVAATTAVESAHSVLGADAHLPDLPSAPGEQSSTRPRILITSPTPEENENYEVLSAQLDDPVFLSSLNLQTFSASARLLALPEALQMVLIHKAIARYNSGGIDPETFLGQSVPVYP